MTLTAPLDRTAVLDEVVDLAQHVTSDWELDLAAPIGPATRLVDDLGFDSIDLVCLFVAIEQRFERAALPFDELVMEDGEYVEDLLVDEVAGFVHAHLAG
jgi:acyl carrier protein